MWASVRLRPCQNFVLTGEFPGRIPVRFQRLRCRRRATSALNGGPAQSLERSLELVGLTGVEDRLQPDVQRSLEELRNAAIKVLRLICFARAHFAV